MLQYDRNPLIVADVTVNDVSEQLPGFAPEPHQLHLRNGGKIGGRRVDWEMSRSLLNYVGPTFPE